MQLSTSHYGFSMAQPSQWNNYNWQTPAMWVSVKTGCNVGLHKTRLSFLWGTIVVLTTYTELQFGQLDVVVDELIHSKIPSLTSN